MTGTNYRGIENFNHWCAEESTRSLILDSLPKDLKIVRASSLGVTDDAKKNHHKTLFKGTFYKERALPMVITDTGLGFGFSAKEDSWFKSSEQGVCKRTLLYALPLFKK